MQQNKVSISVVVPIYNEEDNIGTLHLRLSKVLSDISPDFEIIFVNDGSADTSLIKIKELVEKDAHVRYINFSRNFGHQAAVMAGLDRCCGDAVVIIDADLQDPPELIKDLYFKYKEGYEVVYAQRAERQGETWFKKVTAKMFYRFLKKMTSVDMPLDTGDFRLMDKKIVDLLKIMPEKNKFLRGQIAWLGFRQIGVKYVRQERLHGESAYPLHKMIKFAMDGITSFSDKPLSFVANLGFIIAFASFLIILYALFSHFILAQTISGWTSMMVSSMFIGGIQLISIGIIGQYISRINNDVKNRPLYVVESSNIE